MGSRIRIIRKYVYVFILVYVDLDVLSHTGPGNRDSSIDSPEVPCGLTPLIGVARPEGAAQQDKDGVVEAIVHSITSNGAEN